MAVSDPYALVAEYDAVFPNRNGEDDGELLLQLTAVSRYIDSRCGQFFALDASPVARVFVGDGSNQLWLRTNLGATPTAVKFDTDSDGTFASTVTPVELWPLNAADGPEARPWRRIDLPPWCSYATFPKGMRVEVTARWGWPAVPAAVRQATIHLTAILRLESPRSTSSIDEIGRVVGMAPAASSIIDDLLAAYPGVSL